MTHQTIDVLLVEDNENDAELTIRALKKSNLTHNILRLADGEEALDFMFCRGNFQARSFHDAPKVILLDLKMPKVDGMEVLKILKADPRTKRIPIVLLTSSRELRDVQQSYDLGVNSYLVKPADFQSLVAFVAELGAYWLTMNQQPDT